MAGLTNYRVKVDLSKYHQDARRFSWVYVDRSNVSCISHLKHHIVDIFNIPEPFHLLLNGNEYLPPAEDVRVLAENEVINVEPGSGMCFANTSTPCVPLSDIKNGIRKNVNIQSPENTNALNNKCNVETYSAEENGNETLDISMTDATMYHSMLETTKVESNSESNERDDSVNLSCSMIESNGIPPHKRKRIRRRKKPNPTETSQNKNNYTFKQPICEKPKVVDSYTLPAAKHIRFDNVYDAKVCKVEKGTNDTPLENTTTVKTVPVLPSPGNSRDGSLASLLALRESQSPVVFQSKKVKYENGYFSDQSTGTGSTRELSSALENQRLSSSMPCNTSNNISETSKEQIDYLHLNPEEYPDLKLKTEINDIIAFKILRIGKDYTPQVSNYIIAKTVDWCPKKMVYSFQILKGQLEIQEPSGKFSLPDDETEHQEVEHQDTIQFNFCQLIEPRLINRSRK